MLHDLLVPAKIKHFNKHWIPLTDDRNDDEPWTGSNILVILIIAVDIAVHYLRKSYSGPCIVDARMSWTARCETRRIECSAFRRPVEAIMQAGDPSVLNWTGETAKRRSSHVSNHPN
jgi:hypothetical protein